MSGSLLLHVRRDFSYDVCEVDCLSSRVDCLSSRVDFPLPFDQLRLSLEDVFTSSYYRAY